MMKYRLKATFKKNLCNSSIIENVNYIEIISKYIVTVIIYDWFNIKYESLNVYRVYDMRFLFFIVNDFM